ncbi:hypothetical protein BESB_034610 [Besnoitia besnoiti]|uniref:Uncharacterized protein n=1 Tax=Besnoitia besnoiti TaxID=94643 RepID=A0A2A9MMI0_BESBE|nr:hypothetical protein BESB_034610 [Besnoitia besnoiti]PFH37003.1 hypothetical protein BESB_034610 [Besnoitia besnoiti]
MVGDDASTSAAAVPPLQGAEPCLDDGQSLEFSPSQLSEEQGGAEAQREYLCPGPADCCQAAYDKGPGRAEVTTEDVVPINAATSASADGDAKVTHSSAEASASTGSSDSGRVLDNVTPVNGDSEQPENHAMRPASVIKRTEQSTPFSKLREQFEKKCQQSHSVDNKDHRNPAHVLTSSKVTSRTQMNVKQASVGLSESAEEASGVPATLASASKIDVHRASEQMANEHVSEPLRLPPSSPRWNEVNEGEGSIAEAGTTEVAETPKRESIDEARSPSSAVVGRLRERFERQAQHNGKGSLAHQAIQSEMKSVENTTGEAKPEPLWRQKQRARLAAAAEAEANRQVVHAEKAEESSSNPKISTATLTINCSAFGRGVNSLKEQFEKPRTPVNKVAIERTPLAHSSGHANVEKAKALLATVDIAGRYGREYRIAKSALHATEEADDPADGGSQSTVPVEEGAAQAESNAPPSLTKAAEVHEPAPGDSSPSQAGVAAGALQSLGGEGGGEHVGVCHHASSKIEALAHAVGAAALNFGKAPPPRLLKKSTPPPELEEPDYVPPSIAALRVRQQMEQTEELQNHKSEAAGDSDLNDHPTHEVDSGELVEAAPGESLAASHDACRTKIDEEDGSGAAAPDPVISDQFFRGVTTRLLNRFRHPGRSLRASCREPAASLTGC